MSFIVSHQVLDDILKKNRLKSNDLAGIDKVFGGADGYYWYRTLRQMCDEDELIVWNSEDEIRSAVQGHENTTAAEDEVKPQPLGDEHVAAIARLISIQR